MSHNLYKVSLFLGLALMLALVGCGNPPQLRFGLIAPETGDMEFIGREVTSGAITFADEVNARSGFFSGFTVGVIHYDYSNDPGAILDQTKRLLEKDQVLGLVIYVEDPTILAAVAQECNARNVALVSLSGAGWQIAQKDFTELGADKSSEWKAVVAKALETSGTDPIAYVNTMPRKAKHGADLEKYLADRGRELAWQNIGQPEAPDSIESAVEMRNKGIKTIFVDGSPTEIDPLAYQLALDRYRARFIFLESQDFPEKFVTLDLSLFPEALLYARFSPLATDMGARQFTSGYHGRVGRDPNSYVALGYDGMTLLARAWQVSKATEPGTVKASIAAKTWQLATCKITPGVPQTPQEPTLLTVKKDDQEKWVVALYGSSNEGM
jgi:ABC-type branched-subunit amino acid transport system substrate-binding protein